MVYFFLIFMSSRNTLSASESLASSENILATGSINSNRELSPWLQENGVSPESAERIRVSFMARIPENTPVALVEKNGILFVRVGDSVLKVDEVPSRGIIEKTKKTVTELLGTVHFPELNSGAKPMLKGSHQKQLEAA